MQENVVIKNLTRQFGSFTAVDNISLTSYRGEVLGFLGPNGAGKTTAMRMISGFLTPTSGTVEVCGFDVVDNPIEVKKKIGYMPEGSPAYGDMLTINFLSFIADIRGISKADKKRRIENAIENANLKDVLYKPIETLSKGYNRRVGLAQAIIHDPEILILDEPGEGLDPNQKHEMRNLIKNISPEKSIIISTHILEEVEAICSRIIIINKGQIVANDTLDNLLSKSRYHNSISIKVSSQNLEYTKKIINNVNGIDKIEEGGVQNDITLTLFPKANQVVAQDVLLCLKNNQVNVQSFYINKGRLDEVFRKLTINNEIL